MIRRLVVPCLLGFMLSPPQLMAQGQRSFGVNLGVVGTHQLGVTYHVVPAVTVRPAVTFGWGKNNVVDGPTGTVPRTWTNLGLGLDMLFPMPASKELTPYLGVGGDISYYWNSSGEGMSTTSWGLSALFGARAPLLERVAAYGELVMRYTNDGSSYTQQAITVGTTALGLIVYFD